jgi:hypothetical protein
MRWCWVNFKLLLVSEDTHQGSVAGGDTGPRMQKKPECDDSGFFLCSCI